jgi:hypothetical protein
MVYVNTDRRERCLYTLMRVSSPQQQTARECNLGVLEGVTGREDRVGPCRQATLPFDGMQWQGKSTDPPVAW